MLRDAVVVRTLNMNISRRRFADHVEQNKKPCAARASRTWRRIIFHRWTNQIIYFWRCCCRCRPHFLNFLLTRWDTTTFLQNLAPKWLWYQVLSRQNDSGLRALSVALWENLVLSLFLHLESKLSICALVLQRKSDELEFWEKKKRKNAWLFFQEKNEFFRFMRQLLKLSSKCEDHIFIWFHNTALHITFLHKNEEWLFEKKYVIAQSSTAFKLERTCN